MPARLENVPSFGSDDACPKDRYTVVVLGNSCVGKTAIISQLLYGSFDNEYRATVEEFHQEEFELGEVTVTLDVIDTTGSYSFPAMRKLCIEKGESSEGSVTLVRREEDHLSGPRNSKVASANPPSERFENMGGLLEISIAHLIPIDPRRVGFLAKKIWISIHSGDQKTSDACEGQSSRKQSFNIALIYRGRSFQVMRSY